MLDLEKFKKHSWNLHF